MDNRQRIKNVKIPKNLQSILWSTDINRLDLEKDKSFIIHQVLLYGTFDDIRWLFTTYSKKEIIKIFLISPRKIYPKEVFPFVKNYILSLKKTDLKEDKYVTSISGQIRPRQTESL